MKIAIIGTGYVGLVTGSCFAEMGNTVYCVDNDVCKINDLQNNILPIYEPQLETLVENNQRKGHLVFTDDLKYALDRSNIIFIAVGTPMGDDGSVDLTYVDNVACEIGELVVNDSLIVVKSTVPVGTCFKIKDIVEEGVKCRDVDVRVEIASNPEFLKEGSAVDDCVRPDRVIIGAEKSGVFDVLKKLYSPFIVNHDRFILMDVKSSEMTKYASNAMLATKISFMNEIANICEVTGADIKNVRLGMGSDKRIGYDFIYAGCGYGGSCFPKDVKGLINSSLDNGYRPEILLNVNEVNEKQKMVIVDKIVGRFGEDLSGVVFGVWGLSFKPETDDVRSAPSIRIVSEILKRNGEVKAYDPQAMMNFKEMVGDRNISYYDSKYDVLDGVDALILITEWKEFRTLDLDEISKRMRRKIIFDGRNIYNSHIKDKGFELYQIGRP